MKSIIGSYIWTRFADLYSRIDLEHRQIAKGVLTVALLALLGKGIGAAKEMAIAWRYGISITVDAYLFVFNLAQWPVTLFYSVITAVWIPVAAKIRHKSTEELARFQAEIFTVTLVIGVGLGLLAWKILPFLVTQPWVGLSSAQRILALKFAPWLAWIIPFGMVYALLAAWTMSENRHINTLLDSLPALTLLIAVLVAGGTTPLIVGVLLGFILQPVLLSIPLHRRRALECPVWGFYSPWWRVFWAAFTAMLLGQFLQSLIGIADQFFAAHLGPGELATLGYSNRVLALINAIGAMAIGRALLPVLSQTHAHGGPVRRRTMQWAGLFFLLGGLAAALGILLAPEIVRLLFQRGAFGASDTVRVAGVLKVALVQIPFYFTAIIVSYSLLSQGKYRVVSGIAGLNLLAKLIFGWFLVVHLKQGLTGLMLTTAVVYLISTAASVIALGNSRR